VGSLALVPVVALLLWPALLLISADAFSLYGVIQGCPLFAEGPRVALIVVGLAGANGFLLGSLAYHAYGLFRITRHVSHMPLIDEGRATALQGRLPALKRVPLRLCEQDQPHAFTVGWRRPVIVLSRWVLLNLDGEEILAAIAHELAHIRHRDNRLMFWVHSLCPGGLGLGMLRGQSAHLGALLEARADRIGAAMMGDRLALASALVKVRRALLSPAPVQVTSLTGEPSVLRRRIRALLDGRDPPREGPWAHGRSRRYWHFAPRYWSSRPMSTSAPITDAVWQRGTCPSRGLPRSLDANEASHAPPHARAPHRPVPLDRFWGRGGACGTLAVAR